MTRRNPALYGLLMSCCAFALANATQSTDPDPARLPTPTIEELFKPAFLGQAKLSPDGKFLAAITNDENDHRRLTLINLETNQVSRRAAGTDEITRFLWVGKDRILYTPARREGSVFYVMTMQCVNRNDLSRTNPIDVYSMGYFGRPRARPDNILVAMKTETGDFLGEISTKSASIDDHGAARPGESVVRDYPVPKVDGIIRRWKATFDGEPGYCTIMHDGKIKYLRYLPDTKTWKPIPLDTKKYSIEAYDPDSRFLWVTHHEPEAGFVLQRYDLETNSFEKPICSDHSYDLSTGRLIFSVKERKLVGFNYLQKRLRQVWLTKTYADAQATIDYERPDTDNELVDVDDADLRFLFRCSSPQQPGEYVLFDAENKTVSSVLAAAPQLKGKKLFTSQPVILPTRDKIKIEGYLTLPAGASKTNPPPLVILAHGGPSARDTWTFDPEVQFLASLGYAVLQPNYRGSDGYTPQISSDKKYDYRCMHNDVTDAVRAMKRTGLIDPDRIAIMGGSFGGYLAVSGVAFEPDLYRCAISICGVFDWAELIKDRSNSLDREEGREISAYLRARLGDPKEDAQKFESISPINHTDDIRVPVFIAHGTVDAVVSVSQSKRLVGELKRKGIPHETFFRNWEGHGFFGYETRIEFYRQIKTFLEKNLKNASTKTDEGVATPAAAPKP